MLRGLGRSWRSVLVLLFSAVLVSCSDDDSPVTPTPTDPYPVPEGENVVVQWNSAALQAIRDAKPGPPQAARSLAVVHTAIYDAWAAYDPVAVGTRYVDALRRPAEERTEGRKAAAISFAAFRALSDQFPSRTEDFAALMESLGYDSNDATIDRTRPEGIGNVAAAAVLAFRHGDGSNQLGTLSNGVPYGDYTGYAPKNPPIRVTEPSDLEDMPFPESWQPLIFTNQAGQEVTPSFIAPHWWNVVPFAMTSPSQFRPVPPSPVDSEKFRRDVNQLIEMSANLTDEQKCIAEYWADGPNSELPPGHFDLFGQFVSERDDHTLDDDAKMFFALTNAVFDAGIAAWDAKRYYDYCRPVSAIRYMYHGQTIRAWAGAGLGTQDIPGEMWKPYQPDYFPTPPFPEYVSGHSTFSAAAAEVLRSFTGSDQLGFQAHFPAGSLRAEPGVAPSVDVTLQLDTFTDAAAQAGISRRYGGIHFEEGDLRAREMGRNCGVAAWLKARSYFDGTATRP